MSPDCRRSRCRSLRPPPACRWVCNSWAGPGESTCCSRSAPSSNADCAGSAATRRPGEFELAARSKLGKPILSVMLLSDVLPASIAWQPGDGDTVLLAAGADDLAIVESVLA